MTILIVDDNQANRDLLRVTVEAAGLNALEACDGEEALARVEEGGVDAVISDILMPKVDGYELCRQLRHSSRFFRMPLLLCTSTYTSIEDEKLALSLGADCYLTKPVPADVLMTALNAAIMESGKRKGKSSSPVTENVMRQYSHVLINKIEEKNAGLEKTVAALQASNAHIAELNSQLEQIIFERTAELEEKNRQLSTALDEVKELSGLLPICCYCKNVRDDKNYWHTVEAYIRQRTAAQFSHGICPKCWESHIKPQLTKMGKK